MTSLRAIRIAPLHEQLALSLRLEVAMRELDDASAARQKFLDGSETENPLRAACLLAARHREAKQTIRRLFREAGNE